MTTELLAGILDGLGKRWETELKPDDQDTCLIRLKTGVNIQIELEPNGEYLIAGADLGTLPPGRYREDVFQIALQENGLPYPRTGTFAYSLQADTLVYYLRIPSHDLSGERLFELLEPFTEKAKVWKEAIEAGSLPPSAGPTIPAPGFGGGMFGMRP